LTIVVGVLAAQVMNLLIAVHESPRWLGSDCVIGLIVFLSFTLLGFASRFRLVCFSRFNVTVFFKKSIHPSSLHHSVERRSGQQTESIRNWGMSIE